MQKAECTVLSDAWWEEIKDAFSRDYQNALAPTVGPWLAALYPERPIRFWMSLWEIICQDIFQEIRLLALEDRQNPRPLQRPDIEVSKASEIWRSFDNSHREQGQQEPLNLFPTLLLMSITYRQMLLIYIWRRFGVDVRTGALDKRG